MSAQPVVLLVGSAAVLAPVEDEIRSHLDGVEPVVVARSDAVGSAARLAGSGRSIPLVIVGDEMLTEDPSAASLGLVCDATGGSPRVLLLTDRTDLVGLDGAFSSGVLHGVVTTTWTPGEFARHLAAQIRRGLGDHGLLGGAPLRAPALEALEAPEPVVVQLLLDAIERPLGPRPRLHFGAGTVFVREGEQVNGVFIVLDGEVTLSRRTAHGNQILHRNSAGGVVGLLSFTQQRAAFVTALAGGDVVAVHLTLEQLDQAMRHDPEVGTLFSSLLLQALARRLVRADELHLDVRALNRELREEQDRLAKALSRLEAAEVQLVDSARMATLGELSAGIAHELNNPVGALTRSTEHLTTDLLALLPPEDREFVERAVAAPPVATGEERRRRRDLADALGDRALADRLVRAGIGGGDEALALAASGEAAIERRIRLHQLGASLRNTASASDRIAGLVAGLRSYVRGDTRTESEAVDVCEGLDDTLRLLGHRLQGLGVERHYPPKVPPVDGRPGELNQVWTNLLTNAADALEGSGTIEVVVDTPSPEEVRVRVIDDGPGIEEAVAARLFEPRFTTKEGRVEYGLGLGLTIAKRIVSEHGGTISIGSEGEGPDRRTTAAVLLPVGRQGGTST